MIAAPTLEIAVIILGTGLILLEAFAEKIEKQGIALAAITGLIVILIASFFVSATPTDHTSAFWNFYTADPLAIILQTVRLRDDNFRAGDDDRLRTDHSAISLRRDASIRSWRIFRAPAIRLRRPNVDGLRDRFRHDFRLDRARLDFVLRPR